MDTFHRKTQIQMSRAQSSGLPEFFCEAEGLEHGKTQPREDKYLDMFNTTFHLQTLSRVPLGHHMYSSPMASLVLTDSSQLTIDSFKKLPDQITNPESNDGNTPKPAKEAWTNLVELLQSKYPYCDVAGLCTEENEVYLFTLLMHYVCVLVKHPDLLKNILKNLPPEDHVCVAHVLMYLQDGEKKITSEVLRLAITKSFKDRIFGVLLKGRENGEVWVDGVEEERCLLAVQEFGLYLGVVEEPVVGSSWVRSEEFGVVYLQACSKIKSGDKICDSCRKLLSNSVNKDQSTEPPSDDTDDDSPQEINISSPEKADALACLNRSLIAINESPIKKHRLLEKIYPGEKLKRVTSSREAETTTRCDDELDFTEIVGFVTCLYGDFWWLACVLDSFEDKQEFKVSFLHPHGPAPSNFTYPTVPDILRVHRSSILTTVDPLTATGRVYTLTKAETENATRKLFAVKQIVNGSNTTIPAQPVHSPISVNGSNTTVPAQPAHSPISVNGSNTTIPAHPANSPISVSGSDTTVPAQPAHSPISVNGSNTTVPAQSVHSPISVNGSNTTVPAQPVHSPISVNGSNTTVPVHPAHSPISVNGSNTTSFSVNGSYTTVPATVPAQPVHSPISVNGSNTTVLAQPAHSPISVSGSDTTVPAHPVHSPISANGSNTTVPAQPAHSPFSVNGSNTTVPVHPAHSPISVSGSDTTVPAHPVHRPISVNGSNTTVPAQPAHSPFSVNCSNTTVPAQPVHSPISVSGSDTTVPAQPAHSPISVSGSEHDSPSTACAQSYQCEW
uniref:(California timema) hypothetical protein n=1 Tax=Timema californicum TaxID=61474 RepID=A0A7R9J3R8_TIMCA|nr:unnamed protein product [Timema californicum]